MNGTPRAELEAAYTLFSAIRRRFARPGVERGGCLREGITPVYVRKFGSDAATIFPNLHTVEASYTPDQLQAVNQTLLLLKRWVTGTEHIIAFQHRILQHYNQHTQPYVGVAILRATEAILSECITAHPAHAPVLDAIFRVAGSEGFRDLIQLYGTRLLEQTLKGETPALPDILGFVHMHERHIQAEQGKWSIERYEVWCPGFDLAKEYFAQMQSAVQTMRAGHMHPMSREAELRALPIHLVNHLTSYVQRQVQQVLETYRIPPT